MRSSTYVGRAGDLARVAIYSVNFGEASAHLAGKLDPNANLRAGDAAKVLADVLSTDHAR